MTNNPTFTKGLDYAVRIVNLYKYLSEQKGERTMSKQLLRCSTSIGANISEALSAESSADFIHKLAIAQKGKVFYNNTVKVVESGAKC